MKRHCDRCGTEIEMNGKGRTAMAINVHMFFCQEDAREFKKLFDNFLEQKTEDETKD